jgi:hypothetical protein
MPCFRACAQEELIESASWALAKEEVLFNEQQAAGGADAAGGDDAAAASAASEALAQHPSSMLDGLTATDINKMKVRARAILLCCQCCGWLQCSTCLPSGHRQLWP